MTEINGLAVPCPRCHSHAGRRCRTTGGIYLDEPHRKRVKEAARHQRADDVLDKILREAS